MIEASSAADFRDPGFQPDVLDFYRRHHREQSYRRSRELADDYAQRVVGRAALLERFDALAELRDASDDDLEGMSQLGHALQTTDAIRRAAKDEDWLVLGLIHDLGKLLIDHGEAPEFVVGDTYPTGCAFAPSIRHASFLAANPDSREPASFQSVAGDYLQLFDERDHALRESHMRPFARFDLHTKHAHEVSGEHLAEYRALLARRFPDPIDW